MIIKITPLYPRLSSDTRGFKGNYICYEMKEVLFADMLPTTNYCRFIFTIKSSKATE